MEAHVKAYLVQKFDTGCRTGQKADPVEVDREKKVVKVQKFYISSKWEKRILQKDDVLPRATEPPFLPALTSCEE